VEQLNNTNPILKRLIRKTSLAQFIDLYLLFFIILISGGWQEIGILLGGAFDFFTF
jgi:hypothetical protein